MIEVIEPGPLATIQDEGRAGHASLGVPRSGAFDRGALALANRLVGNTADAAGIEFTLGAMTLRFLQAVTVTLTGPPVAGLDWGVPVSLPAGSHVRFGRPAAGARNYLAVRGGIDVTAELGSRSTDMLSGIGAAPLRTGDRLPVGTSVDGPLVATVATTPGSAAKRPVRVVAGPRDDWFVTDAVATLTSAVWTVGAESNRIGVRLDGPLLVRRRVDELVSEPTLPGAIQVPPDGRPIVLGPDAPVTGGYPVIAVLRRTELDIAAQWRPGDQVRFIG